MGQGFKLLMLATLLTGSTMANAALIDRGGGLLYDDVLNITWLQDANYARTIGYDADGEMTWTAATAWASNLTYGGFSDWRLASNSPINGSSWDYSWSYDGVSSDRTYNVVSPNSELGYMYYVNLGIKGEYSTNGSIQSDFGIFGNGSYVYGGQSDVGLVRNLQSAAYWSATELGSNPYYTPSTDYAWWFNTHVGSQYFAIKQGSAYAWAVRDGDVGSTVPEPGTFALLGLGLAGLGLSRTRRTQCIHVFPFSSRKQQTLIVKDRL